MADYVISLSEYQEKVLLNDLLDIQSWIQLMVDGKIFNCSKRLADAEKERLIADGAESVPTSNDALCQMAFERPTYENRAQREARAEAQRQEMFNNPLPPLQ